LTDLQSGLVVSLLPLGSLLGCVFGAPLCDKIGRWKTIQIQNAIFICGALIIAGANSISAVYVGRVIVGIGSALSAVADIPYLTEIAPLHYRGRISSAYEMLVVIGILASFLVDLMFADVRNGWR
jgi:MFS family permease